MNHYTPVSFRDVEITGGFWKKRQDINRSVSINAVYDRFADTGRIDAFRFDWKEGMPNRPHFFWDSDVAKWMESAAYLLQKQPDPALEAKIDALVEQILAHQEPNGYFNIYFTVVEPDKRFTIRDDHELYCAGHLMEAAVAYADATGKRAFLEAMCRYADCIEKVFRLERSAPYTTPGHEEIELALVKLYHATGERRYLELSKFFIDARGNTDSERSGDFTRDMYDQHHLPCREQTSAEGHSVRAVYLYSGMSDIARETGDEALLAACKTLFDNITQKRMFVTGGIGSSAAGEMFTIDYDLPNKHAYAESCAAIGLAFFAQRMTTLELDSRYADTIERILYNGFLSSVSLDGRSFFYENALEIDSDAIERVNKLHQEHLPPAQRAEVFGCSCCPPNITRFVASLGSYLYTTSGNTVYCHQYMDSESSFTLNGHPVHLTQRTNYPYDGVIELRYEGETPIELGMRFPEWADEFTLSCNGQPAAYKMVGGYICMHVEPGSMLRLTLSMPIRVVSADPRVSNDCGRCVIMRGPVIFCLEGVDNGGNLHAITVDSGSLQPRMDDSLGVMTLEGTGSRRLPGKSLYGARDRFTRQECPVRMIPYHAFANRGVSDMLVWVHVK